MKKQKSLNEEQRALVASVTNFTEATVKAVCNGRFRNIIDDIIQDAHLSVCHAALMFDPSLGTEFETYIYPFIIGSIRTSLHQYGRTIAIPPHAETAVTIVSLIMRNDEEGHCSDDLLLPPHTEEDEENLARIVEEDKLVDFLLGTLNREEMTVIRYRLGFDQKPMSFKKMAAKMNLSPLLLQKIYNSAMLKLSQG